MSVLSVAVKCELYFGPQKIAVGYKFARHLRMEGLEKRCFGLENEIVKMWLEYPSSYPDEYKKTAPFLMKSVRKAGHRREAPYLFWNVDRVLVYYHDLGDIWGDFPALIASE